MNKKLICIILIILNILFWIGLSIGYAITNEKTGIYTIIKILLFVLPLVFGVFLYGFIKEKKFIYILSLFAFIFNAILSITDEVGTLDFISLALSLITFVFLILNWTRIMKPKTIENA